MSDRINTPKTEDQLEMLLEKAYQSGSETILEHNEEVMPMFTIVSGNHVDLIATPWMNDLEKKVVGIMIKRRLQESKADAYSFSTECWTSKWKPGEPRIPASESPNRKEALIALAVSRAGEKLFRSWEIIRSPEGKAIALRHTEPIGFESWLVELFK